MNYTLDERAARLGEYIATSGATVRSAARRFGLSKSTVHKDVAKKLPEIDPNLAEAVRKVLDLNKAERHIRGGLATKEKYQKTK